MSRFNKRPSGLLVPAAPIVSTPNPHVRTGNSAPGFTRDPQGELFLLAVSNFVGQNTSYETGVARDERFKNLVRQVAKEDPAWMARFLPWLRNEANMRTASMVGAVEFAAAMTKLPSNPSRKQAMHGRGMGRATVDAVLQRADEPGEALGYWLSTYPGQQIPKPVKRGIADAATRLYNEYNTLKYDTASHGLRFGDVLELVHPSPDKPYQMALFKHLIDRRHGRDEIPSSLTTLHLNAKLRELAAMGDFNFLASPAHLREAGMTWEDALSLAGNKLPKNQLWEAMIPNMGYMALLKNLRNFDEAGIGNQVAEMVGRRLASPDEVARSRQLPMRFLSAFRAVSNVRWHYPLEQALQHSLNNIPQFAGRTLVLIDTSGSMNRAFSKNTELMFWDAAAIFGLAVALRCEQADVISFSGHPKVFMPKLAGASLLTLLNTFQREYFLGGGTDTRGALHRHYRGHDRVVILTDEQADAHGATSVADGIVPQHIPIITFNLVGYQAGHMESGSATRITIGGLSDSAFKLLPVLEARGRGQWPF